MRTRITLDRKAAFVILFAGFCAVFAFSLTPHLIINTSSSVPGFLFWRENLGSLARWDYVLFPPPDGYSRMLSKGNPLIKRVWCLPGDFLFVDESGRFHCKGKDGEFILERAIKKDSKGVPLRNFHFEGRVPEGCYFVAGQNLRSYDSRYFGFVKEEDIIARAKRIL